LTVRQIVDITRFPDFGIRIKATVNKGVKNMMGRETLRLVLRLGSLVYEFLQMFPDAARRYIGIEFAHCTEGYVAHAQIAEFGRKL
jgi:hypothetical protein